MARTFRLDLRVRYAETDGMGVVHHASYVPWLEEARIDALAQLGYRYAELERNGILMPVVALDVRYRRSMRFDDVVRLLTQCTVKGPSRLSFTSELYCGEDLCANGHVVVAAVDPRGRPQRIPADIIAAISVAAA
ncbi:MAG: acyl-CoA thioesterase [Planctomycetota bacterium]|nr:MAG: acyl-CoA thioesterase [Planctomycetota bacterium]